MPFLKQFLSVILTDFFCLLFRYVILERSFLQTRETIVSFKLIWEKKLILNGNKIAEGSSSLFLLASGTNCSLISSFATQCSVLFLFQLVLFFELLLFVLVRFFSLFFVFLLFLLLSCVDVHLHLPYYKHFFSTRLICSDSVRFVKVARSPLLKTLRLGAVRLCG